MMGVVLLYSDAGLRFGLLKPGEVVTLDLPDIPFRGPATVVKIQPSVATAEAEAEVLRVVRFRHDDDLGTPLHGEWDPLPEFVERWKSRRREVILRLDYPDGSWCDIQLLRTVTWIADAGAKVGATIFLDLAEVGTRGWANVLEVLPCGPVAIGPGDMVTGTFRHSHGRVGELVLESESESLGVTPGHLFWSVDRQSWVPVGRLRCGETLQTLKGLTRVVSYTMTDRVEPVYNIEVEGSHCYRVGESGVLVHNMSAKKPDPNQPMLPFPEPECQPCPPPGFERVVVPSPCTAPVGAAHAIVHSLPDYFQAGEHAYGILVVCNQAFCLRSGYTARSEDIGGRTYTQGIAADTPFNFPSQTSAYGLRDHVEAAAAAIMRVLNAKGGVLYINQMLCGSLTENAGCRNNVVKMLPKEAKLQVHYSTYTRISPPHVQPAQWSRDNGIQTISFFS